MTIPIKYAFPCLVANYSLRMTIPLNTGIDYVFQFKKKKIFFFFTQTQLKKKKKKKLNELCGVVGHPITKHGGWSNQTWCCSQDHPREPFRSGHVHHPWSTSGVHRERPQRWCPQGSISSSFIQFFWVF